MPPTRSRQTVRAPAVRKPAKVQPKVVKPKPNIGKAQVTQGTVSKADPLGFKAGSAANDPGFRTPDKRTLDKIWKQWTRKEQQQLSKLDSPGKIQAFLDAVKYDPSDDLWSVRRILKTGEAHCLGSSLLAYYALIRLGYECALLGFDAVNDDGHAICVFRQKVTSGYLFGAVSKSNYTTLRARDCVYASLRELVMSYYDFHFNLPRGEKTMTEWTAPFNAWTKSDPETWLFSSDPLLDLEPTFDEVSCYAVMPKADDIRREGKKQSTTCKRGRGLMLASKQVIRATKLGGNPKAFAKAKVEYK